MAQFFTTLASMFRRSRPAPRKARPTVRRVQLGLESLEGRDMPSVSPMLSFAAPIAPSTYVAAPPTVVNVPNLTGYSFHLLSSNGKPAHDLVIQSETYNADGSASFTGTWAGDGPNGSGVGKPISNGTIRYDSQGNIHLSFSWTNGSGTQNTFCGILTPIHNNQASSAYIYGTQYHLEGDVYTPTPGDGPGHIYGDSQAPTLVMKLVY